MRRREWTDPAPLEVERPRLPWWTMLPRKLLYVLAPIIAVAVVIRLLVFVARRLYRYPVAVIGAATLATLGVTVSWWASAGLLALLVMVVGVWAWWHRDSFDRTALRQVRSEWRRARVYAWPWRRVMLFCEDPVAKFEFMRRW